MRTIGILGGMSWHSTVELYRVINETVHERLGGQHSAEVLIDSLDFESIRTMQLSGEWTQAGAELARRARRLEAAGADAVTIGTNLMHKVAAEVEAAISVPLLHIGDAVAGAALAGGHARVGLLGTSWTMAEPFYAERLALHGVETIVPDSRQDCAAIDEIIFAELTLGRIREESRAVYLRIMAELADRGATAIVLGCTEIPLLITESDTEIPLIDSTAVLGRHAAEFSLASA